MKCAPDRVSEYVRKNIMSNWKYLTKSLTSNASERWNRKIEKVIAKRYGLKSVKFVEQLITALWLKESMRNKIHFENSFIHKINLTEECQEYTKMCSFTKLIAHNLLKKVM